MKRLHPCWNLLGVFVFSVSLFGQIPRYRGWVNDFAGLIGSGDARRIESLAQELKDKTGVELAVVTVENMGGEAIEPYAAKLFETWGIGQKDRHNGVLFLLALEERRMRIEVGYGLEGILPDGLVGEIRDEQMLPDFRAGRYGSGFYQGVRGVASVVAKEAGVTLSGVSRVDRPDRSSRSSRRSSGGGLGLIFIIFLLVITRGRILPWLLLSGMMGGGGGRRYDGFGGGGGFSGFGGGGFGGFGGGMSGGGGASGSF